MVAQPCRQSCMNKATMQYEWGRRGSGRGDRESQELTGSAGASGAWRSLRWTAHDQLKPSDIERHERGIHAETADGGQALPATEARPGHGSTSRHDRDMPLSHTVLNCGYNQHD